MSYRIARKFAEYGESDTLDKVVLKFRLENKRSKYFICLDRPDYSMYPEEKELILQSGLKAKVERVVENEDEDLTIFNLVVTDDMVKKEKRKRTFDFAMPIILLSFSALCLFPLCVMSIEEIQD